MEEFSTNIIMIKELTNSRLKSIAFLETSRRINLIASICVIIIGFFGNLLVTLIFIQKKFRSNSSHIYLLCSAINDNLFILIHLFEDTLRTYKTVFTIENHFLINLLNITDQNDLTCRSINYLRNILRFISVYIVVAFTVQRLFIVYQPLSLRFKRKKAAWKTVLIIAFIALVINLWVPFIFQINLNESKDQYCDIDKKYKKEYFYLNIIYIGLIMLVPMILIVVCNILIIFRTFKNDTNRKKLQAKKISLKNNSIKRELNTNKTNHLVTNASNVKANLMKKSACKSFLDERQNSMFRMKPHYSTLKQLINKKNYRSSKSSPKRLTVILLVISFSFVALNLPYLIEW